MCVCTQEEEDEIDHCSSVCDCPLVTYLDPQDGGCGHSDSILVLDNTPYSAGNDSIVLFILQHKGCNSVLHGATCLTSSESND